MASCLAPLIAVIAGAVLLGEVVTILISIGAALALTGVVVVGLGGGIRVPAPT